MWRPRLKSSLHIHDPFSPTRATASSSPSFSCSSFKDIQHLCADDPSSSSSSSPKTASRIFHRVRIANSVLRSLPTPKPEPDPRISIPGAENSIVLYSTSLRVVRSTFEDCQAIRSILRGFRVRIEERDLSMDASFESELRRIFGGKKQTLPRVFIGGNYVGGAEEVKQMHEIGELKKLVERLPKVEQAECEGCGGYRFIPCEECHGSHKVYREKVGFRSCRACNENGLVRCSSCSTPPLSTVYAV